MEESITQIITIAGIIYAIFGIVILVRWWRMTSDIRDIRDHLLKKDPMSSLNKDAVYYSNRDGEQTIETMTENAEIMNKLIAKIKPNQCIVKVRATSKLEIWNKTDWDDIVKAGRTNMFERLYNNYEEWS